MNPSKFLLQQAAYLCRVRWGAIALVLLITALSYQFGLQQALALTYLALIAITAILNLIGCVLYHRYLAPRTQRSPRQITLLTWWTHLHTLSDILLITAAIHYTGGIHSPGIYLLLTYIGALALTYGRLIPVMVFTTTAALLFSGLFLAYARHWLTAPPPFPSLPGAPLHPHDAAITVLSVDGLFFIMAALALSQSRRLRRLWEKAEKDVRFFAKLHELSHQGLEQTHLQATLGYLSEQMQRLMHADGVHVVLWEEHRETLHPVASYNAHVGHDHPPITHTNRSEFQRSCLTHLRALEKELKPLLLTKEWMRMLPPSLQQTFANYQNVLLVPLHPPGEHKLFGILTLGFKEPLREPHEQLLNTQRGMEIVIPIFHHALTLHKTAKHLHLLQTLASEAILISQTWQTEALTLQILDTALRLFQADGALLLPMKPTNNHPAILDQWSASGTVTTFASQMARQSEDFSSLLTTSPETFFQVPNIEEDPSILSPATQQICKEHQIFSLAAFLVPAPPQEAGMLLLCWQKPTVLSPEEIAVGRLFATYAGTAIYNAYLYNLLRQEARTDALTTLPNRRALDETLEREIKRAHRYHHPLSIAMVDLNFFKSINDRFGHQNGDRALVAFASLLTRHLRETDFVGRYGGDEFLIILPETGYDNAQRVMAKIQEAVTHIRLDFLPAGTTLNAAYGIATYPQDGHTAAELIAVADKRLYLHKPT